MSYNVLLASHSLSPECGYSLQTLREIFSAVWGQYWFVDLKSVVYSSWADTRKESLTGQDDPFRNNPELPLLGLPDFCRRLRAS